MFWILVFSYWIHLLATVIWFGSLVLMAIAAWPALRKGAVSENSWLTLQKQLTPWANISLVLLLITGFVQMTNDPNYSGFMVIDSTWAWAMLVKHIAFGLLAALTVYLQFSLYPAADRIALLAGKRPQLAKTEQQKLTQREKKILWLNVACAVAILFCTAVATAV
ncbi:CopD family protein [Candidatus Leptofilum sp.]|uniref:CopD family protein n=1 Tax=Candidatus Leptofilum sp. TaxID=3241576 RepID=UPI003B58EC13